MGRPACLADAVCAAAAPLQAESGASTTKPPPPPPPHAPLSTRRLDRASRPCRKFLGSNVISGSRQAEKARASFLAVPTWYERCFARGVSIFPRH